jgi:hypothetical protein
MYLVEMRPWFVGMPLKPPEVCGRLPAKPVVVRDEDEGRWEPTMPRALPVDRELPACEGVKAFRCCSGSEKLWPSWRVTTRMPGFGALTTGAWESASEAAGKEPFSQKGQRRCGGAGGRGKDEEGKAGDRDGGIPIVLSFVGVAVPEMEPWLLSSFSVTVALEGDRENVLERGPRWVSLSSAAADLSAALSRAQGEE